MGNASLTSEYLNYDETKRVMGELNQIFVDYHKLLTDMDTAIEDSFNAGEESALSSKLGGSFLIKWNSAAAHFADFKLKFENYYSKVMKVSENNQTLEQDATSLVYAIEAETETEGTTE